ncbi:hypothetical protein MHYP_G00077990 [Metynnis hypsauchen]
MKSERALLSNYGGTNALCAPASHTLASFGAEAKKLKHDDLKAPQLFLGKFIFHASALGLPRGAQEQAWHGGEVRTGDRGAMAAAVEDFPLPRTSLHRRSPSLMSCSKPVGHTSGRSEQAQLERTRLSLSYRPLEQAG